MQNRASTITDAKGATLISKGAVFGLVLGSIFGIVCGLILYAAFFSNPEIAGHTNHTSLIYTDFITIILTAITVLFALLGSFLAVMAIVGYTGVNRSIDTRTSEITSRFLDTALKRDGVVYAQLEKEIENEESDLVKMLIEKVHARYIASLRDAEGASDENDVEPT